MHTNNRSAEILSAKVGGANTTGESRIASPAPPHLKTNETCGRPGLGKMHSENHVDSCQLREWPFTPVTA